MKRTHVVRVLAAAGTVVFLLATAACGGGSPASPAASPAAGPTAQVVADAKAKQDARIAFLEERAARDPLDTFSLNSLAMEHMQRARETGDVSELTRAEDALDRSLKITLNGNYDAIALLGSVSATKHDFSRALSLAQVAISLKPNEAFGYGVLGDASMGLGRYDDAAAAYEKAFELSPDLSAFGRQALLFQTRGLVEDAEKSWAAAISQAEGDGVPEHAGWAHAQLANLYFMEGRIDDADAQYQASLAAFPGYVHALAGIGRVAAARGDTTTAINYYTRAVNAVPLPEYVIALGDVYTASGDAHDAESEYALVGAIEQLYAANGVNLDLQIGMFNADHNRAIGETLARARGAYAQQPSLQATDVLAWVQYKAGDYADARQAIERALSTGTRDPLVLYHAGMIDRANGDLTNARTYLERVEAQNPAFSVLQATVARSTLDELEAQAQASGVASR